MIELLNRMNTKRDKQSKLYRQERRIVQREKSKWWLQTSRGNIIFVALNVLFAVIVTITFTLSIFDRKYQWICWDRNSIGVLCQIITTIVSIITSIIGIAIPLQKDNCWGISIKEFNKLRVERHYPIVIFIILAIIFSVTNATFYISNMFIASIGIAFVATIFCIYVTLCEIPIIIKDERYLAKVIRSCLFKEWRTQKADLPKELKTVLKYLIASYKTLNDTYLLFKSKNERFNKYLLHKLLELQTDTAFELEQIVPENRIKIAKRLYENIGDLLRFKLDLSEIYGDQFLNFDHYITRVIIKLNSMPECTSMTSLLIADEVSSLRYDTFSEDEFAEQKIQFILSISLAIITLSIREGNFSFIKALQKNFSINYYDLKQDNYMSLIFALVSMQFYFLCNDSQNASDELKSQIKKHLDYSDIINHTKVYSWKSLYSNFAFGFNIDFKKFMKYFSLSEKTWDVPIYYEAYWVKLNQAYAFRWYFTNVLNSFRVDPFDYSALCFDETYKSYLIDFCTKCFDNDKNFIVTDEMQSILDFYGLGSKPCSYFRTLKELQLKLFNYVNDLKKKDLLIDGKIQNNKTNDEIANQYKETMQNAIQNEWGYDSAIEITSSSKNLTVFLEKASNAINYEVVMSDALIRSLFHELRSNISPTIISRQENADDNFDESIKLILKENITMSSEMAEGIQYYIKDNIIREQFVKMYSKVQKFNSDILTGCVFIKNNGFSFNVTFDEFSVRNLTEKELSEEVENYKSADGQYVYDGTFLSREEIERLLFQKYAVLKIIMRYGIKVYDNDIIEVKLFE